MDSKQMNIFVICFVAEILQKIPITSSEEFCHYETFKGECPVDHVILVNSAFYGRKNLGRCVRMNFGFVGCYSSVLYFLDNRCSGRESCKVEVIEPSFDNIRPCNDELKSYLEAEYTCIRVMKEHSEPCHLRLSWKPDQWTLPSNPACGTEHAPWSIHGPASDLRLKIDFVQFSAEANKHSNVEAPSITLMIRESPTASTHAKMTTSLPVQSNSTTLIFHPSSNLRHQHLYTTFTSSLQLVVRVDQPGAIDDFMLLFGVICPEIHIPQNMVVHYSNNRSIARVTCKNADQSWTLVCGDAGWQGGVGNCSSQIQRLGRTSSSSSTSSGRQSRLRVTTAIVAIIVVGVSVSISLCVLVFGLLIMKRIKGSKLFRRSSLLVAQSQMRTTNEPNSFIALMPMSGGQIEEKLKEFCPLKAQMLASHRHHHHHNQHHNHPHHQCPVLALNLKQDEQPVDQRVDHANHVLGVGRTEQSQFVHPRIAAHDPKNGNHLLKCIACSRDDKFLDSCFPDLEKHFSTDVFSTSPPDFLISSVSDGTAQRP